MLFWLGRRLDEMSPGQYKSTMNPTYPVLVEGHWQDLTQSEQQKHDTVHQLQVGSSLKYRVPTAQGKWPKIFHVEKNTGNLESLPKHREFCLLKL